MTRDEIYTSLAGYIRQAFLDEKSADLLPETPLLEWGVLNSMNTAKLLTYMREELGIFVPPTRLTGKYFKNLNAITDLAYSLSVSEPTTQAG